MKTEWKMPSPLPLVLLLAAVLILGLCSCGITRKAISKQTAKTDSSYQSAQSSASVSVADTSGKSTSQVKSTTDSAVTVSSGYTIRFAPAADSASSHKPIVIKETPDGLSIDPGDRTVASIQGTSLTTQSVTRKTDEKKQDSTRRVVTTTTHAQATQSGDVKKTVTNTSKNVTRFQIPWYAFLIGGLIAAALIYLWLTGRLKKKN